jgi:multidrug efflux pump subunit AcrA (membrane-fusion protein)
VGTGVQGVSVTVPLPQIDQVKPGQRVTVAADGRASVLHGTVTSVGLVSTTSGSTTSFPVAIRLDARSPHLYDGTGADVVIVTGTATDVPVVPNSAIHSGLRSSHTVTIVKNGKAKTEPVTVGIAGSQFTQITSGLKAGQQVEIADPSQSLPSSTSSNTGFGGFGGLGRFVRQGGS